MSGGPGGHAHELTPFGRDLESQQPYAELDGDDSNDEPDSGRSDSSWSSLDSNSRSGDDSRRQDHQPSFDSSAAAAPPSDLQSFLLGWNGLPREEEKQRDSSQSSASSFSNTPPSPAFELGDLVNYIADLYADLPAEPSNAVSARAAVDPAAVDPAAGSGPHAHAQPPVPVQQQPNPPQRTARRRGCSERVCHCPAFMSRDEVSWHCSFGFLTLVLTIISVVYGLKFLHTPSRGVGFHIYSGVAVLGVLLAVVSWSVNSRPGRGLGSWWSWWQMLLIPPLFVAMVAWTAYAWISYPEPGGVMPPDVCFSFFMALFYGSVGLLMGQACLCECRLCHWDEWYEDSDECCCFLLLNASDVVDGQRTAGRGRRRAAWSTKTMPPCSPAPLRIPLAIASSGFC